jgi:peptidoglycan/xylan/chitin deacetylase (PgdA/CDA1 family)
MRFSNIIAAPMVAQLVSARVPQDPASLKRNILESRQSGESTINDPRPQKGNIPYGGAGIRTCTQPGTVAITFDDGPNVYTGQVLDTLKQYGFKATFFVCGDNGHGAIDADTRWMNLIKRMDNEGHQVASHTWSHPDLSTIPLSQVVDEMIKTEMAIRNILDKYPTYMRPPYTSCGAACQTILKKYGYVIAYQDLDTLDWAHQDDIQQAKDNFKSGMDSAEGGPQSGHRIVLAHDIHEQTVTSLTPYMLQYLKDNGWKGVTLGECLGEPKENWYRPSQGSTTPPPPDCSTGKCEVSKNGLCGGTDGTTCAGSGFGDCCSQWGYCGEGTDYCGANCNPAFGTCGSSTSPTQTPSPTRVPTPTPTPSKTATPTPTGKPAPPSSQGLCGEQTGETCTGSIWGECCSKWGFCGSEPAFCGTGCNKEFGTCT